MTTYEQKQREALEGMDWMPNEIWVDIVDHKISTMPLALGVEKYIRADLSPRAELDMAHHYIETQGKENAVLRDALQKCLEAANAHECKALHSGKLHEVVQEYARAALDHHHIPTPPTKGL